MVVNFILIIVILNIGIWFSEKIKVIKEKKHNKELEKYQIHRLAEITANLMTPENYNGERFCFCCTDESDISEVFLAYRLNYYSDFYLENQYNFDKADIQFIRMYAKKQDVDNTEIMMISFPIIYNSTWSIYYELERYFEGEDIKNYLKKHHLSVSHQSWYSGHIYYLFNEKRREIMIRNYQSD